MPIVGPAKIKRHWIVAAFTPPEDTETELGAIGGVETFLHPTLEEAKNKARELAAGAPGAYYVVYEAEWYAYTDITPVNLRRVGESVVG